MSAAGSTRPSGWMTFASLCARTTCSSASVSRMLERNWLPSPSPLCAPATSPAMSWNSIVSGTMFDDADRPRHRVEPLVVHRHDRHVRLDRRERVVGGLGAGARERVEQRRLARVGHPDDADLHHRPSLPSTRAERGARGDVGRVVHAEVEPRERHPGRRPEQRPARQQRPERLRGGERRRRVRRREREAGRRDHQVRQVLDDRAAAADRDLDRRRDEIGGAHGAGRAQPARSPRRSTRAPARPSAEPHRPVLTELRVAPDPLTSCGVWARERTRR